MVVFAIFIAGIQLAMAAECGKQRSYAVLLRVNEGSEKPD
jgi:hypothetical protein